MTVRQQHVVAPAPTDRNRLTIVPIGEALSLKARAYEALKAAITNMTIYDKGAELKRDERALSTRFGVSRTPMREALAQLDREGLVKVVPRRGSFIVRKTKAEMLDMITVWAALESMAARLSCGLASDEEIAALHELTKAFSADDVDAKLGEYSDANIRFHTATIALAHNPLLIDLADGLFFHVRAIRRRTIVEEDRARKSIGEHNAIIAALEKRDAELAERLVREHTLKLRGHVECFVELD
jgi:DNA-binding GntR family transcriptional regulator